MAVIHEQETRARLLRKVCESVPRKASQAIPRSMENNDLSLPLLLDPQRQGLSEGSTKRPLGLIKPWKEIELFSDAYHEADKMESRASGWYRLLNGFDVVQAALYILVYCYIGGKRAVSVAVLRTSNGIGPAHKILRKRNTFMVHRWLPSIVDCW